VVAVGPGKKDDGKVLTLDVKAGDPVLRERNRSN